MALAQSPSSQTAIPSFDGIFPLPLTIFESLMFLDARPGYAMWADMEARFKGRIDRAAFDAGLAFAIARNPLLNCLVAPAGKHSWQWVPSNRQPFVDWAPVGTPLGESYDAYVDLTVSPGLKIYVRESEELSTIRLHEHHACSDGLGLYAFLEDLMVGYHNALADSAPIEPRPLDPDKLRQRGLFGIPVRTPWQQIYDIWVSVREGLRFFREAPLPLPRGSAPIDASCRDPLITRTLPPETAEALRRAATRTGAMTNDVLIRDLMLTVARWHAQSPGGSGPPRNVRVCIPQNLRERRGGALLPACNAVSFAFITRRTDQCADPEALLASLAAETRLVRQWKLSLFFLGGLAAIAHYGLLSWLLRRKMCFSTIVLSNIGDPTRYFRTAFPKTPAGLTVGNLEFLGMLGSPPTRPLTRGAIGVIHNADGLIFALRHDPHTHSTLDAERLLDDYVSQLRATAAQGAAAEPGTVAVS